MRLGYTARNKKGENVEFFAHSTETANKLNTLDARNWMINHLDFSEGWGYSPNGKFKHDIDSDSVYFINQPSI